MLKKLLLLLLRDEERVVAANRGLLLLVHHTLVHVLRRVAAHHVRIDRGLRELFERAVLVRLRNDRLLIYKVGRGSETEKGAGVYIEDERSRGGGGGKGDKIRQNY